MSEPAISRPRRRWRWVKRIGIAILILPFLAVAVLGIEWKFTRIAGQRKLDAITARLDAEDPGWRFDDIVAAHNAKVPPDESNSGLRAVEIAKRFPKDLGAAETLFSKLNSERLLNEISTDEEWAELESKFAEWEPHIAELRRWDADMPRGAFKIDHTGGNPVSVSLNNIQKLREAQKALAWDATRLARRGEPDLALGSAMAGLNLVRSVEFEPMMIAFLVRIACGSVAMQSIEQTLAWCPNASDVQLAAMQKPILKEEGDLGLKQYIRGERAYLLKSLEFAESEETPAMHKWSEREWEDFDDRKRIPSIGALCLERFNDILAQLDLPSAQRLPAVRAWPLTPGKDGSFVRMILPTVVKVVEAETRYRAKCLCTAAGIACERYRLKHNRWPEKLDDLAEFGIPKGFLDPFDGQPLRYTFDDDGPIIYSIGPDGVVDGSDIGLRKSIPRDVGFRLWNVDRRRVPKE